MADVRVLHGEGGPVLMLTMSLASSSVRKALASATMHLPPQPSWGFPLPMMGSIQQPSKVSACRLPLAECTTPRCSLPCTSCVCAAGGWQAPGFAGVSLPAGGVDCFHTPLDPAGCLLG
jgi:hypothetical protein